MARSAQKNRSSTQKFIEIQDIVEDIVVFGGGNACLLIEVQAVNFALLSKEEQDAKVFSYASLLNSLSFPIQIVIQNKSIDISSYVKLLEQEVEKRSIGSVIMGEEQSKKLSNYIKSYRDFVSELVKINIVLDKKFYIAIPYSYLEKGIGAATGIVKQKGKFKGESFVEEAKNALHTKANSLISQLVRLSLRARTLEKEDVIKVFYSIYNPGPTESSEVLRDIKTAIVKGVIS